MAGDNTHSSWSDLGTKAWHTTQDALQNRYVADGAVTVAALGAAVAVIASRGKLVGLAEKYLPKAGSFFSESESAGTKLGETLGKNETIGANLFPAKDGFNIGTIPPVPTEGKVIFRPVPGTSQILPHFHVAGHDQVYPMLAAMARDGEGTADLSLKHVDTAELLASLRLEAPSAGRVGQLETDLAAPFVGPRAAQLIAETRARLAISKSPGYVTGTSEIGGLKPVNYEDLLRTARQQTEK